MALQDKKMKANQMANVYGGGRPYGKGNDAELDFMAPSHAPAGRKRAVPNNVNVSKPSNQKEALAMLNDMMANRVSNRKAAQLQGHHQRF